MDRRRERERKQTRLNWLEGFRNKTLEECIHMVKRGGDMSVINSISDHDFGISTIVQFTPSGSLVAWSRGEFNGDEVRKVHKLKCI